MAWLYVALGGAIGSMLRYALSVLMPFTLGQFPWATWWANIIGCSLAGMFLAASEKFTVLQGEARLFLLVGILGGFTTFSSFGLETFNMLKHGLYGLAMSYVGSSLIVGLLAVMLGYICLKFVIHI